MKSSHTSGAESWCKGMRLDGSPRLNARTGWGWQAKERKTLTLRSSMRYSSFSHPPTDHQRARRSPAMLALPPPAATMRCRRPSAWVRSKRRASLSPMRRHPITCSSACDCCFTILVRGSAWAKACAMVVMPPRLSFSNAPPAGDPRRTRYVTHLALMSSRICSIRLTDLPEDVNILVNNSYLSRLPVSAVMKLFLAP